MISKRGEQVVLELLAFSALLYGGAFTHGYFFKDDKLCKDVIVPVPTEYLIPHKVTDCMESGNISCNIPKPRYIVDENNYINLNHYVKGMRTYLDECKMAVEVYNSDKYVE